MSDQIDKELQLIQSRLERTKKLQTVYEGNKSTIEYWSQGEVSTLSIGKNDVIVSDMEEKESDILSALTICLREFSFIRHPIANVAYYFRAE